MGDLKGHAIPGSFFLLYGFWSAIQCFRRFLNCHGLGRKYIGTASYTWDCCQGRLGRLPVEGFLKVALCAGGLSGELLAHLPVPPQGIVQHSTMYFFFLLSGLVDLAIHYGLPLPDGTDYLALVLALCMEGLLFLSHVGGRSQLDTRVHLLLVTVIYLAAAVTALEVRFRKSALLSLCRAYLFMLQGSWFWAVGIILYGHGESAEDQESDDSARLAWSSIYFCWHCAALFILLLVLGGAIFCWTRRKNNTGGVEQHLEEQRITWAS